MKVRVMAREGGKTLRRKKVGLGGKGKYIYQVGIIGFSGSVECLPNRIGYKF